MQLLDVVVVAGGKKGTWSATSMKNKGGRRRGREEIDEKDMEERSGEGSKQSRKREGIGAEEHQRKHRGHSSSNAN